MNTSHSGGETDRPDSLGDSLVLRVNRPRPDVVLIIASGAVDESTAARFERLLFARIEDAVRTVLLDLTGVGFLAVSALQLLARAGERARERGVELALVATGHEVLRALHITELPEVVPVHPSVRAALCGLDDRTDPS
ncbi:STAS domain-containing protein [Saccharopolyspora sp. SCSIO 74807]|uniref:STAS domain-containing protein n=1 Tax=Saccharopolyspora sp. SCSIO 74807 TaxID=3118084 RepID=UPI0030CED834